jgi:4-hydroxybenzoate polyprenyltransferase
VFLYGGAAVLSFSYVLILFLLALLANVSREITKDIEDMTADKVYRQTLPLTAGKKRATEIAKTYLLWAVILSFLPILFMIIQTLNSNIRTEPSWSSIISRTLIYAFGVILADAVFINSYYAIKVNPKMAQERMKLGMLIAMLAFFLFGLFGLIIKQGHD